MAPRDSGPFGHAWGPGRSPFALAWCSEIHPYPRLEVPGTHFAYDEVNGRPDWGQFLSESPHTRFAPLANHVQGGAYRLISTEFRRDPPRLVTGDRCSDCLALPKLAEGPP